MTIPIFNDSSDASNQKLASPKKPWIKNLTLKYVFALGLVAFLSVIGQILIQLIVINQSEGFKKIQLVNEQVNISEDLGKQALILQLNTAERIPEPLLKSFSMLVKKLKQNHQHLKYRTFSQTDHSLFNFLPNIPEGLFQDRFTPSLIEELNIFVERVVIAENKLRTLTSEDVENDLEADKSRIDFRLLNYIQEIIRNEELYRSGMLNLLQFYEKTVSKKINQLRLMELFLLGLTLLVLFLEGLYIFRPAVHRLQEALRVREEFLNRMGHEVRNPMNSILGMSKVLARTPLSPVQKQYLSLLQKSGINLLEMLNNILDFSGLEQGKIKIEKINTDLPEIIQKVLNLVAVLAHEKSLPIVVNMDLSLPQSLETDPIRLQQILGNLLNNAVKFTEEGEVWLKMERKGEPNQDWLLISVEDTGIGIIPEKAQEIFEGFVQGDSSIKRKFGGSGLGLAICKELSILIGGKIEVDLNRERGAKFIFSLPLKNISQKTLGDQFKTKDLSSTTIFICVESDKLYESIFAPLYFVNAKLIRLTEEISLWENLLSCNPEPYFVILNVNGEFSLDYFSEIKRLLEINVLAPEKIICLSYPKKVETLSFDENWSQLGIHNFLSLPFLPMEIIKIFENISSNDTNKVYDSSLNILVVDDSPDNRLLLSTYLQDTPHQLVFAENGQEAIEIFQKELFDLVLLDIQMPKMDGFSALEKMRDFEKKKKDNKKEKTPVIAVTGHDYSLSVDNKNRKEFHSYLLKPIAPELLIEVIKKIAKKKNPFSTRHFEPNVQGVANEQSLSARLLARLQKEVPLYIENRKKEFSLLWESLDKEDFHTIQRIGHQWKGSGASYGFNDITLLGEKIERAAKNQDGQEVKECLSSLREIPPFQD